MNFQELISTSDDFQDKSILILGSPASGKTYLSKLFAEKFPGHTVLHTDDYMHHGWEQSLYALIDDLKKIEGPTIIEGIQGYRLLRKGLELDFYYPDVVIDVQVTEEKLKQVYNEERDPGKLKSVMSTIKSCATILEKYNAMENRKAPEWITIQNVYE